MITNNIHRLRLLGLLSHICLCPDFQQGDSFIWIFLGRGGGTCSPSLDSFFTNSTRLRLHPVASGATLRSLFLASIDLVILVNSIAFTNDSTCKKSSFKCKIYEYLEKKIKISWSTCQKCS